jgi:hypothetical protein
MAGCNWQLGRLAALFGRATLKLSGHVYATSGRRRSLPEFLTSGRLQAACPAFLAGAGGRSSDMRAREPNEPEQPAWVTSSTGCGWSRAEAKRTQAAGLDQ